MTEQAQEPQAEELNPYDLRQQKLAEQEAQRAAEPLQPETPPAQKPKEQRAPVMAGNQLKPLVADSLDSAWRMAHAFATSGMLPKDYYGRPADVNQYQLTEAQVNRGAAGALVAMQVGAEVGLLPMQAINSIAVINGRPTMWGDSLLALVRASGFEESTREWLEGEPLVKDESGTSVVNPHCIAWCETTRKGHPPTVRGFSVADAQRANLWMKASSPWVTQPKRMLQMRARSFALRDTYPDVLRGLYSREEIMDGAIEGQAREVTQNETMNLVPQNPMQTLHKAIPHNPSIPMEIITNDKETSQETNSQTIIDGSASGAGESSPANSGGSGPLFEGTPQHAD